MAKLDYEFKANGKTVVLRADITAGWRRKRRDAKTYYYSQFVRAEWQGGYIRAAISVFPGSGGLTQEWEDPPVLRDHGPRKTTDGKLCYYHYADGTRERYTDCCTIGVADVADGLLVLEAQLLDRELRRPKPLSFARLNRKGNPVVERFYEEGIEGRVFTICQVQLRLTFEMAAKPAPVERSFWNEFLCGGRPESNRRRFRPVCVPETSGTWAANFRLHPTPPRRLPARVSAGSLDRWTGNRAFEPIQESG